MSDATYFMPPPFDGLVALFKVCVKKLHIYVPRIRVK